MAASANDARIFNPVMHSLFHLALARTALPLFNDFDIETLESAFTEIQRRNSAGVNEGKQENPQANRAKETLLFIPAHLRHNVFKAVLGMHYAVDRWEHEHYHQIKYDGKKCVFHWTFDGMIDRTKTAQQLVLNENIKIKRRFNISCMYSLDKSVKTLWAELEAAGETENIKTYNNSMTRFGVKWMREGSRIPWLQAAGEYLETPHSHWAEPSPRYSSFYPSLRPEDKERFLSSLEWGFGDDIRFCLYAAATKEEKDEILKMGVHCLLYFYLDWPLQSFFLETAEKVWNLINVSVYINLLTEIWLYIQQRKDVDYCQLFADFWNKSPAHLKEGARKNLNLSERIDLFFLSYNKRWETS